MTFLNLGALFGLAAVAIPIIIHLLNKFQVKEVTWAAMRFLRESIEKNQRRLQLEDLLLLLLRCLLIILLIVALSRPTWQSGIQAIGSSNVTAVIIIDDSYSMGVTNGIQTRLQQAQAAAEQILQTFPSGSSSALFYAADNVQPVIALPTLDFNLLRKTIRDAKLTDRSTNMPLALQQAIDLLKKQEGGGSREIYIITDGQANGWPQVDDVKKQLGDIQKEIAVHLVLVGDQSESNMAVTDVRLDGGLAPVDQPLRCSIQVKNASETEARDVRVSLSMDNEPATDETIIDSIAPGTARSVALFAKLRTEGYHTITAQIPHDRLPADDQRTVAVRATREVKVLLVNGTVAERPSQADDFFVRNALVPVPPAEVDSYFIKTTSVNEAQLAGTSLDDYDAVFLLQVDSMASTQVQALNAYVNQGGGLVIFPGPQCNIDFYNQEFGADGFLPARLGPWKGQPNQEDQFFTLQDKDYDHPITALWNDPAAGTLASSHFYVYYPLTLTPWKAPESTDKKSAGGEPRAIMHFTNNDLAAAEHTWGLGRVVLFSSTATTVWNDLPAHQAFVPLMNRVLGSLVERQDEGLNVAVGQKFSYAVSNDLLNKDVSVTAPGEGQQARVVGQVSLVDGAPVVEYGNTDYAGAYHVAIGSSPSTDIYFAAQSNPVESDLTPLSPDQLKSLGEVAQVTKWSPDASLAPTLTAARTGKELWVPLLWAALILGTAETFFAHRFSQSK